MENKEKVNNLNVDKKGVDKTDDPPIMKSWKNIYIFVLGSLLFYILVFSIFTYIFK